MEEALKNISNTNQSDVFLISGQINNRTADKLIHMIKIKDDRNKNCTLILTTYGGDPDAGYRIARAIKNFYTQFHLLVYGYCKSTGTLISLAADEIIMGDFAEFGPLDIQLAKDDELSHTSGLSYIQSLLSLSEQIYNTFERNFLLLKQKSENTITTKTAADISSSLAVGLLSPISAQLDPLKLGEVQRAVMIAKEYGERLTENFDLLQKLIVEYPAHGFVIDREEANLIYGDIVRGLNDDEERLEKALFNILRRPSDDDIVSDLIERIVENNLTNSQEKVNLQHEVEERKQNNNHEDETNKSTNNSNELKSTADKRRKSSKPSDTKAEKTKRDN